MSARLLHEPFVGLKPSHYSSFITGLGFACLPTEPQNLSVATPETSAL